METKTQNQETGGALAPLNGSAATCDWKKTPPDRDGQGYWWWWNGDDDCAPVIITIMYSGTSDKCFVCISDDPDTRDVDNYRWDGWWKRIPNELPPNGEKLSHTAEEKL